MDDVSQILDFQHSFLLQDQRKLVREEMKCPKG